MLPIVLKDADWGYAMLGRDRNGVFRAVASDVSIPARDAARGRLVAEMERLVASGQTVLSQGDEH